MRKLSHYEQRWRDGRQVAAPVADDDVAPSDVARDDLGASTDVGAGEVEIVVEKTSMSDATPSDVEMAEEPAGEDAPADDAAPGPPGETKAERRKRLKRQRAERRGDGGSV